MYAAFKDFKGEASLSVGEDEIIKIVIKSPAITQSILTKYCNEESLEQVKI